MIKINLNNYQIYCHSLSKGIEKIALTKDKHNINTDATTTTATNEDNDNIAINEKRHFSHSDATTMTKTQTKTPQSKVNDDQKQKYVNKVFNKIKSNNATVKSSDVKQTITITMMTTLNKMQCNPQKKRG